MDPRITTAQDLPTTTWINEIQTPKTTRCLKSIATTDIREYIVTTWNKEPLQT